MLRHWRTGLGLLLVFFSLAGPAAGGEQRKPAEPVHVQLDGSGSSDADGDNLQYFWRQIDGPEVTLSNPRAAFPTFLAKKSGCYRFELTVSDGRSVSDPAVVEVIVERQNIAPVALIVPTEIKVKPGREVVIDGATSYDDDNDPLRYRWRQVAGPALNLDEEAAARPRLAFTPVEEGGYELELVVNDGQAASIPCRCHVTVERPNVKPIARVVQPQKVVISVKSKKESTRPVAIAEARTKTQAQTPKAAPAPTADTLPAKPKRNGRPIAKAPSNLSLSPGESATLSGLGFDPEGTALTFCWRQSAGPLLLKKPAARQDLTLTPKEEGLYIFELVVSDGELESEPATVTLTVSGDDIFSPEAPAEPEEPVTAAAPEDAARTTGVIVTDLDENAPPPDDRDEAKRRGFLNGVKRIFDR